MLFLWLCRSEQQRWGHVSTSSHFNFMIVFIKLVFQLPWRVQFICSELVSSHVRRIFILQFILGDFPVFIAVLMIKHVFKNAVDVDPWPKSTFALFHLQSDELWKLLKAHYLKERSKILKPERPCPLTSCSGTCLSRLRSRASKRGSGPSPVHTNMKPSGTPLCSSTSSSSKRRTALPGTPAAEGNKKNYI